MKLKLLFDSTKNRLLHVNERNIRAVDIIVLMRSLIIGDLL